MKRGNGSRQGTEMKGHHKSTTSHTTYPHPDPIVPMVQYTGEQKASKQVPTGQAEEQSRQPPGGQRVQQPSWGGGGDEEAVSRAEASFLQLSRGGSGPPGRGQLPFRSFWNQMSSYNVKHLCDKAANPFPRPGLLGWRAGRK